MIVGTGLPDATRRSWSPSPVRPGICMSVIKQAARFRLSDARNSSADAKASAAKPSDFMSACIASRTDSSSSTIEMSASFDILLPAQAQDRPVALPTSTVWDPARRGATILWGQLTSVFLPPARVLGHECKPSSPNGRPAYSLGQYSAFQRNGKLISIGRLPAPPAQTPASLSPSLCGGAPFTRLICKVRNDTARRAVAGRLNECGVSAKLP